MGEVRNHRNVHSKAVACYEEHKSQSLESAPAGDPGPFPLHFFGNVKTGRVQHYEICCLVSIAVTSRFSQILHEQRVLNCSLDHDFPRRLSLPYSHLRSKRQLAGRCRELEQRRHVEPRRAAVEHPERLD